MTRIVTSVPRPKRPPKKRKAVALEVPAVVRKRAAGPVAPDDRSNNPSVALRGIPANDDPKPAIVTNPPSEPQAATSFHGGTKPVIVTSISRKRARQRRAGYTPAEAEPDHDPPDDTLMQSMARMIRPPE